MILYMKVSRDKYQLPEIVCESLKELAERSGVKPQTISGAMNHAKKKGGTSYYVRVEVDDEE